MKQTDQPCFHSSSMIQAIKRPVYIFSWGFSSVNWEHTSFIASYTHNPIIESIRSKVTNQLSHQESPEPASELDLLIVVLVYWVGKEDKSLQIVSSQDHRNTWISFLLLIPTPQSEKLCIQHSSDNASPPYPGTNDVDRRNKSRLCSHPPTEYVDNEHRYEDVKERTTENTLDFDNDSMICCSFLPSIPTLL